jgi:hypothetical protein
MATSRAARIVSALRELRLPSGPASGLAHVPQNMQWCTNSTSCLPSRRRHTGSVTTRYAELVAALRRAVFDGHGAVDAAIRRSAGTGASLPDPWAGYVAKVRDASYRITDDDVAALKASGCTEEEIFEVTVAAATGAALHRLELGLRGMDRGI